MNDQPKFGRQTPNPLDAAVVVIDRMIWPFLKRTWQGFRAAWPTLLVAALWYVLVYVLPLGNLRASRQTARLELAHLLQTEQPDVPAVLAAFDRATEQVLFSASGPYFILGLATLLLFAHVALVKRRLRAAERDIQALRSVVLGADGLPHRRNSHGT